MKGMVIDMVVLIVIVAVLVSVSAAVATAGLYIGLLGILGVSFRVVHCERSAHLSITSTRGPIRSCPYCRHERLLHPVHAVHHQR